ncbi:unnamed protein product [Spirodela intermedia]|uniref:Late embryogenesis abundant protein LEA-2 subgroup domain-containing protein n=1 Tax=Spirodela intermedia TaxID=51605 RepID=A0A7I8KYQ2_SPIIN|nr:unnamed protein product [Spirodela intermedia]
MAERTYPPSKPVSTNGAPNGSAGGGGAGAAFPATKAQLYGATRPVYRPQAPKAAPPRRRRGGRGCCCCCCIWVTLILLAIIFLAAIAGGIFYVIYRPQRPSFSVSSLKLSTFNVTTADAVSSRLDLSVTARNPNKKLVFLYEPISISATTGDLAIGDGSFPAFVHEAKNTTVLKAEVASASQKLDSAAAADLRKKTSLPMQVLLETRAGVKVGSLKTKKMRIRVSCTAADVPVPKGKTPSAASSPDVTCKVKLRLKIWKWYF